MCSSASIAVTGCRESPPCKGLLVRGGGVVDRLVEDEIEELIEAAEDADHATVAVQLQPELLVHVPAEGEGTPMSVEEP